RRALPPHVALLAAVFRRLVSRPAQPAVADRALAGGRGGRLSGGALMARVVPFVQASPDPPRAWSGDWLMRSVLTHRLPGDVLRAIEPQLAEMEALAAGPLARRQ